MSKKMLTLAIFINQGSIKASIAAGWGYDQRDPQQWTR